MHVVRNDSEISRRFAEESMMIGGVREVWNVVGDNGEHVTHVIVSDSGDLHRAYKYEKRYSDREIMEAFEARTS